MFKKIALDGTPFVIAEVGQNHQGDLDVAREYIRIFAYMLTHLHTYTPTRLHAYTLTRLHAYTFTRLHIWSGLGVQGL